MEPIACTVYRCSRQNEMFLFVRAGLLPEALPEGLRRLTGQLTEVMRLRLTPHRKLARVDVQQVMAALNDPGYFVQMPPGGAVQGHLHDGD